MTHTVLYHHIMGLLNQAMKAENCFIMMVETDQQFYHTVLARFMNMIYIHVFQIVIEGLSV